MADRHYFIYIVTNAKYGTLFTGFTDNLVARIYEHKNKLMEDLDLESPIDRLVYYEIFENPESARRREKEIKSGTRKKKIELIESINKDWADLYYT